MLSAWDPEDASNANASANNANANNPHIDWVRALWSDLTPFVGGVYSNFLGTVHRSFITLGV